uniref:Uncharacterized protein n=1 Tax=Anolis carolinensis TaxID=28377 RepID=A0A803SZS5_ANOCA
MQRVVVQDPSEPDLTVQDNSTILIHKYINRSKEKRIAWNTYQWHLMERDRWVFGTNRYFKSKGLVNID